MNKVLITGGCGMIGSCLAKRLVNQGLDVYVVDNFWRGKKEYLIGDDGQYMIDPRNNIKNIDLSIPYCIDSLLKSMDYVIHLADVVAGIGYVMQNESSVFNKNIAINQNVIESIIRNGGKNIKKLIYVGTACSFPKHLQDSSNPNGLREEDLFPADPESGYGWSKLIAQIGFKLLAETYNIKTMTLMLHNVYGPNCDYGERSQVIPSLIRKAINFPNEEFVIWGNGSQARDFVYVEDVAEALELAMNHNQESLYDEIQIGSGRLTSMKDLFNVIKEVSGKDLTFTLDESKPSGDLSRYCDNSKAAQVLGWTPTTNIKDGISKQYDWIQKNMTNGKNSSTSTN
jgi:GDP-D-mannose 3',5'-epimerase